MAKKMNGRKKLLSAFIAVIIIVLLFSVLGIVVLYLGGGTQRQAGYPDTQLQEVDLSFETEDGEIVTIPAQNLEEGTATVTIREDGEAVIENNEVEETLPENTEE